MNFPIPLEVRAASAQAANFKEWINLDIGIDLGTANTVIYLKGKGIVLREPSVVAVSTKNNSVIAVGVDAKNMTGRTPQNVQVIRPLKNGVVTDTAITSQMLDGFIKKAVKHSFFSRHNIIVCVPSCSTEVEKIAAEDVISSLYARQADILEEPLAAALGAGLDIKSPVGCMVLDIGGGTSETAVISSGDIVVSDSVKAGGDAFDRDIENYIKNKYHLTVGTNTAEQIKINIGCASLSADKKLTYMNVSGRNQKGLSSEIKVSSSDVCEALSLSLERIAQSVRKVLENTPPELSADILDNGLTLTGGGALLRGIDLYLSQKISLPVKIADQPLDCVAAGAGKLL